MELAHYCLCSFSRSVVNGKPCWLRNVYSCVAKSAAPAMGMLIRATTTRFLAWVEFELSILDEFSVIVRTPHVIANVGADVAYISGARRFSTISPKSSWFNAHVSLVPRFLGELSLYTESRVERCATLLHGSADIRGPTISLCCYGRRTYSGRSSSSIRFSAFTAVATSVARR